MGILLLPLLKSKGDCGLFPGCHSTNCWGIRWSVAMSIES